MQFELGEGWLAQSAVGAIGGGNIPEIYEPGGIKSRRFFDFAKFRKMPEEKPPYPSTEAKPCLMAYWIRAETLLSLSFDIMLYL